MNNDNNNDHEHEHEDFRRRQKFFAEMPKEQIDKYIDFLLLPYIEIVGKIDPDWVPEIMQLKPPEALGVLTPLAAAKHALNTSASADPALLEAILGASVNICIKVMDEQFSEIGVRARKLRSVGTSSAIVMLYCLETYWPYMLAYAMLNGFKIPE